MVLSQHDTGRVSETWSAAYLCAEEYRATSEGQIRAGHVPGPTMHSRTRAPRRFCLALRHLTQLEVLGLRGTGLAFQSCNSLVLDFFCQSLAFLPRLTALDMHGNGVTEETLRCHPVLGPRLCAPMALPTRR